MCSNNLPELGSKVYFIEEDGQTKRQVIKSGLVFAHMIRYGIGPLVLVDTTSEVAGDMACSEDDITKRCCPKFLFDSAEAAGASLDNL